MFDLLGIIVRVRTKHGRADFRDPGYLLAPLLPGGLLYAL